MSDLAYNVWCVVTDTLGLLGLLPLAWIYTQLPSRKFHALEHLMDETEAMFRKGLEDGLHTGQVDLFEFHSGMLGANISLDDVRHTVCKLKTWRAELKAWWHGLSGTIARVHGEVDELRLQLIDSSSRDRRRLAAEGYANALARYSGALSQERRSSILSLVSGNGLSMPPAAGGAQACEMPSNHGGHPPPRRTDSPLPIPEYDISYPARPSSHPRERVYEDTSHVVISDAGLQGLPSVTTQRPESVHTSPFVSDTDLKHLLALALTPSCCHHDRKEKCHGATRRDILLRFGKHLFGPNTSFDDPEALLHTKHAKRARLKAAKPRMRGTQGLPLQGAGEAVSPTAVDYPILELAQDDGSDALKWQDE